MDKTREHASDCALHNGPVKLPRLCSCRAEPGRNPIDYGSEFPAEASKEAYLAGLLDGMKLVRPTADLVKSLKETTHG